MLRNLFKILLFIVLSCYIFSCNKEKGLPTNINEYKAWFLKEDNGFIKKRCINELCINVQYKPNELMAVNEIKILKKINNNKIDSVVKTYNGSEYFIMEISHKNSVTKDPLRLQGGNLGSYGELTENLAFLINKNLQVVKNGKDTLYPSISHLEIGYELSGIKKIIIAFPGQFKESDEVIFIYDDEIFGVGRMRYKFDINRKNVPAIPLNQNNEVNKKV